MPALLCIKAVPGNHVVQSTSHFCEKLDVFQAQTVWANPTPDLIILGLLFKSLRAAVSFLKIHVYSAASVLANTAFIELIVMQLYGMH